VAGISKSNALGFDQAFATLIRDPPSIRAGSAVFFPTLFLVTTELAHAQVNKTGGRETPFRKCFKQSVMADSAIKQKGYGPLAPPTRPAPNLNRKFPLQNRFPDYAARFLKSRAPRIGIRTNLWGRHRPLFGRSFKDGEVPAELSGP